jgi:transcriptional regulator with XRE-family HTH domain
MASSFGSELKRLRIDRGLSQQSLAGFVGVTQGMIGHLERGLSLDVQASTLFKLCRALNVDCGHFEPFLRDEPPEPAPKPKRKK